MLFLVGNVDNRDLHHIARRRVETGGRCSVSGPKHLHPRASASRSEFCSSRDLARPPSLSFALAMIVTMNARQSQRTHFLSGMGSSLNASKYLGMGVTDLAPI